MTTTANSAAILALALPPCVVCRHVELQAAEEKMTSALGAVRAVLGATGDEAGKG